MKKHILVIEDDGMLNDGIAFALEKEGYMVHSAYSLEEAQKRMGQKMNLILLDINLPDGDGRDFFKNILAGQPVPVLFLTARNSEEDMLKGFGLGCDDYITKPFSIAVLVMKIKAVLKRSERTSRKIYAEGELVYDFENKTLYRRGDKVELTALEVKLLEVLISNKDVVLTRETLLEKIWDTQERYVEGRTLNVSIHRLREKVEANPEKPVHIRTVFGIGYKWE
ncbi:MAG: response regulator transcription factor [Kineothrix sp.]|nr:response regulator transcription factor [Kineothrix sp.]NBI89937.1 DNA-binding response regulator [Lachnospiraceae bacterium]